MPSSPRDVGKGSSTAFLPLPHRYVGYARQRSPLPRNTSPGCASIIAEEIICGVEWPTLTLHAAVAELVVQ